MKKLLIIGNGFDLAHGLNTNYIDFLDWACENGHMDSYYRERMSMGLNPEEVWISTRSRENRRRYEQRWREDHIFPPQWLDTLLERVGAWIDLENNLSKIVSDSGYRQDSRFKEIFDSFLLPRLEMYIAGVVNQDQVEPCFELYSTGFLDLHDGDCVLNFNYSDTFARVYGDIEPDICYVNGKAEKGGEGANIVFGCDFYDHKQPDATHYYKIEQRYAKGTCDKYKKWLAELDDYQYEVSIVGHSLGKTDWHIIRPFVVRKGNKTTVYHHNDQSKRNLIHHLIGMIGEQVAVQQEIAFKHLAVHEE